MTDAEPPRRYDAEAPAPLDGVRVLDLSRLVAGNMLTHVLADLGAEVVKVERPGHGDDLRAWTVEGHALYWKVYARNKKSVTLDLRSEAGRRALLRLAETAQVLVENFQPGTLEAWGLGPDRLHEANPGLVVARISGWGQDGPYRDRPGFGSLIEGMSGFAAMNGYADRPPVLPPLALADMVAGVWGSSSVLVALREVEVRGGAGQVVDLSLFEPLHAALGPQAAEHALTGRVPPRRGSRSGLAAPRNVYACADGGHVSLSASMQSMFERLMRAIGRPDLIDDARFATNADRVANDDALDAVLAEFIAGLTRAEALRRFEAAGVTVGEVCDAADLHHHPYLRGRGVLADWEDTELGRLPMHEVPGRLSTTPGRVRRPAPALGEHNEEVLGPLGLLDAARRAEDAA